MANASTSQPAHVCPPGPADGLYPLAFDATTSDGKHNINFTIYATLPCEDAHDLLYYLLFSKMARIELYHNVYHIQEFFPQPTMVYSPLLSRGIWFGAGISPDYQVYNVLNKMLSDLPPKTPRSLRK